MRVTRRSLLGGAVGSLALLFGGFGWRESNWLERPPGAIQKRRSHLEDLDIDPWTEMQNRTARDMAKQFRLTMDEFVHNRFSSVGWVGEDPVAVRAGPGDSKIRVWSEDS